MVVLAWVGRGAKVVLVSPEPAVKQELFWELYSGFSLLDPRELWVVPVGVEVWAF